MQTTALTLLFWDWNTHSRLCWFGVLPASAIRKTEMWRFDKEIMSHELEWTRLSLFLFAQNSRKIEETNFFWEIPEFYRSTKFWQLHIQNFIVQQNFDNSLFKILSFNKILTILYAKFYRSTKFWQFSIQNFIVQQNFDHSLFKILSFNKILTVVYSKFYRSTKFW